MARSSPLFCLVLGLPHVTLLELLRRDPYLVPGVPHVVAHSRRPTTAKLPDGSPYTYAVNKELDVLGPYVRSMEKAGIGHGFYYSLGSNFWLDGRSKGLSPAGPSITPQQWQAIEIYQLTELWTTFGNLTEIWLDGGFTPAIQTALRKTFTTYQPRVVAMNGGGPVAQILCVLKHVPRDQSSRTGEPHCGSHCHGRTAAPPLPIALPRRHCIFCKTRHILQGDGKRGAVGRDRGGHGRGVVRGHLEHLLLQRYRPLRCCAHQPVLAQYGAVRRRGVRT